MTTADSPDIYQNISERLTKFPVGTPVLLKMSLTKGSMDKVYHGEVVEVTDTTGYTPGEPCWHLVRWVINPESDAWSETWYTGDQLQVDLQKMRDRRITEITK